jgi:hypothetical protein
MKQNLKHPEFLITAALLLILFVCVCCSSKAQQYQEKETTANGIYTHAGAGSSAGFFAGQWLAGYRQGNKTIAAGFTVLPNNTQPVLFKLSAGYNIINRIHVYAAAVRVTYSHDDKKRNYNTYGFGAQYHIAHYDRGTFYGGLYYTPGFTTLLIGMSYNLMHKPE